MLLVGAALVVSLGSFSDDTLPAVVLVGAGVAIEAISRTWYSVFQAHERLDLVSLSVIVQRTMTALVGVVLLKLGAGVVIAATVFAAGALLGLGMALLSARRLGLASDRADPRRWRALLRAGLPIGVASLLFVLLLRLDVTLLSFLSGEAEVGDYAAAYRLVESTQFLAWAISAAMLPWLARAQRPASMEGGLVRGYELGLKAMNAVLLPIGLAFLLFAEPLVDILYGETFSGAVLPLQLLGLTSGLYGIQNFASTTFVARERGGHVRTRRGRRGRAEPRRQRVRHPALRRRRRGGDRPRLGGGARGGEPRARAAARRPRAPPPGVPRPGRRARWPWS